MRRRLLIIVLVMLLTGCTKIDESSNDYNQLIVGCLSKKTITNNVALGYKFYVPRGVKLIKNYDYNQILMIDNDYIYLYVDIISYYYKNKLNNKDSMNSYYYYQEFSSNNKFGYIAITENEGNSYYIKIIYNYAKIEFYTSKEKMSKYISLTTIILNNIEYNDIVIENILENNSGSFSNIKYQVDKPLDASSNFSHFLEEFVQEDDGEDSSEVLPDE